MCSPRKTRKFVKDYLDRISRIYARNEVYAELREQKCLMPWKEYADQKELKISPVLASFVSTCGSKCRLSGDKATQSR